MKQLWAPWRMAYLVEHEPQPGCVFCRHAREPERDVGNFVLFRATHCFVVLNLYPYNSGHLMVVPYQHTGTLGEVSPETGAQMFATAQLATEVFTEIMRPQGFNLGMNVGEAAGAGIADHVHLHVVPRWSGDTNFVPVLADAKVIPELLSATAAKLRPAFERLAQRP